MSYLCYEDQRCLNVLFLVLGMKSLEDNTIAIASLCSKAIQNNGSNGAFSRLALLQKAAGVLTEETTTLTLIRHVTILLSHFLVSSHTYTHLVFVPALLCFPTLYTSCWLIHWRPPVAGSV